MVKIHNFSNSYCSDICKSLKVFCAHFFLDLKKKIEDIFSTLTLWDVFQSFGTARVYLKEMKFMTFKLAYDTAMVYLKECLCIPSKHTYVTKDTTVLWLVTIVSWHYRQLKRFVKKWRIASLAYLMIKMPTVGIQIQKPTQ